MLGKCETLKLAHFIKQKGQVKSSVTANRIFQGKSTRNKYTEQQFRPDQIYTGYAECYHSIKFSLNLEQHLTKDKLSNRNILQGAEAMYLPFFATYCYSICN